MFENRFVAVGRIERLITTGHALTLVIGGAGPVKALVAVELRDAALIKLVTNGPAGFAAGDVVSVSGRLEIDVDTLRNAAVASPDGVSASLGVPPVAPIRPSALRRQRPPNRSWRRPLVLDCSAFPMSSLRGAPPSTRRTCHRSRRGFPQRHRSTPSQSDWATSPCKASPFKTAWPTRLRSSL